MRGAWTGWVLAAVAAAGPAAARPAAPAAPPILGAPLLSRPEVDRPDVAPFPPTPLPLAGTAVPASYNDPPSLPPARQQPVRAARLGLPIADTDAPPDSTPATTAPSADPPWPPAGSRTPPPQPAAKPDTSSDFLFRRPDTGNDWSLSKLFGADTDANPKKTSLADWSLSKAFSTDLDKPAKPADSDWNLGKLFGSKSQWRFGENIEGLLGERGDWFRSDHAFDGFISPVTNPFLFEDPRSLTEVRPIFMYQKIPDGQPDFRGGSIAYFGVQGRLAVTDRLSFVFNKLGGIWVNPGSESPINNQAGFSELWFGPKYTFIRNEQTGSLVAGGLQFQVPVGTQSAFQNNGTLSLVPYVSAAQNLFRDFSAGSFNLMGTTGYSFSTTPARSDYYYLSGHIDMDVLNQHTFWPLFEMNYYMMTTSGNSTAIGSEGRDLINFGGQAAGKGLLTGAFGARYKITDGAYVGGAFEIPFAGPRDLFLYRCTLDFILRY